MKYIIDTEKITADLVTKINEITQSKLSDAEKIKRIANLIEECGEFLSWLQEEGCKNGK